MKKIVSFLLIAVMMVAVLPASMLQADAATVDRGSCGANLTWTLDSNGTLTISGTGAMYDYSDFNSPFYDFDVRCYTTSIVVKSGVTTIGDYAFYYNNAMSVSLPTTLKKIGYSAFYGSELKSVVIPSGVTMIDQDAFCGCDRLASVSFPNTLKTIGKEAFFACNALTSVSIPSSVTKIGYLAFSSCGSLSQIYFAGNAPEVYSSFPVTADVYYSPNNSGWTDDVKEDCESFGELTWHPVYGPSITAQPADAVVLDGKTATVTVKASGKELKYYWYFAGKNDTEFAYTSSFKSNKYSVIMNSARDGRRVYCKIVDYYGNAVCSKTATIKIGTKITQQPTSVKVPTGKVATVKVAATGEGLTYKWYFANPGSSQFHYTSSFKSNTYYVTMDASRNGRRVYCVVTDKYGNALKSNTVTLERGPAITVQPKNVAVISGKTATVKLTAIGEGLTYKWYFANPGSSQFRYTSSFKSNIYSVLMDTSRNGRKIYCVITDKYGSSVKSDVVSLNMNSIISGQSESVSVANGKAATVRVSTIGTGLTYKWYFANPGSSKFYYTTSFKGNTYSVAMNDARDGRRVYCVVTNASGKSETSDVVTLSMSPKITKQPANVSAENGEIATTSVTATGEGLTYKWYYKDAGSSKFYLTNSYKTNKYSVEMNGARDGRQVYCEITDKYGNATKTNTVTLGTPVKILSQPKGLTVANGSTASVSFTASGHGLTYKWYFANSGSSNFSYTSSFTSNKYSVTMSDARDGRRVYCKVTDMFGNSVDTDTVTLNKKASSSSSGSTTYKSIVGSWRSNWFIDLDDSSNDTYNTSWTAYIYDSGYVYLYTDSDSYIYEITYRHTGESGVKYYEYIYNSDLVFAYDPYDDEMTIMLMDSSMGIFFDRM